MPEENEEWVDLGSTELDALDTRTELSSERFWQSPNLSSPSSSKSGSGTLIGSAFSRVPSPAELSEASANFPLESEPAFFASLQPACYAASSRPRCNASERIIPGNCIHLIVPHIHDLWHPYAMCSHCFHEYLTGHRCATCAHVDLNESK